MADSHSFRSGVTTMVDTGTAGARNFLHFKRTVIDLAQTLAQIAIAALPRETGKHQITQAA